MTLGSETMDTSTATIDAAAQAWATAVRSIGSTPPINTSSYTASYQDLLRERRRTLQTISELSTQTSPSTDRRGTALKAAPIGSLGLAEDKIVKNSRRRSLPTQSSNLQLSNHQPSLILAPADISALYRSNSDAVDSRNARTQRSGNALNSSTGNLKRRSLNSALRRQTSPLSTVNEGEQIETPKPESIPASAPGHSRSDPEPSAVQQQGHGIRSGDSGSGPERLADGWNARREKERAKREQAVTSARLRREREREGRVVGLTTGSSATLPSASPRPVAEIQKISVRRHTSVQVQQASPHKYDHSDRSRERIEHRVSEAHIHAGNGNGVEKADILRRANLGGGLTGPRAIMHRHSFHNTAIDPSWTPHKDLPIRPLSTNSRRALPRSASSPAPYHEQRFSLNRSRSNSAGGKHTPSPESTYSSSVRSNASGISSAARNYSRPTSWSGHPNGAQVKRGNSTSTRHYEAVPATEDRHSRVSSPIPPHPGVRPLSRPRNASRGSQRSNRNSVNSQHSNPRSRPTSLYNPPLEPGPHISRFPNRTNSTRINNTPNTSPPASILYRENPDKRASAPEEHEKLALYTAEKEREAEERQRGEKTKERVRRANELEEEKAKELKGGTEKRKSRGRGLFCGLFVK